MFRCIKNDALPGAILPNEEELDSTTNNGLLELSNGEEKTEEETGNKRTNAERGLKLACIIKILIKKLQKHV